MIFCTAPEDSLLRFFANMVYAALTKRERWFVENM
jgi:hypothetical protein